MRGPLNPLLKSVVWLALVLMTTASLAGTARANDPDWLNTINYWRAEAGLSAAIDQPAWDSGIENHLAYLEDTPASYETGQYASAHTENPASPYYTPSGATEAGDSDLDLGGASNDTEAINDWLAAPFHAIGMLRAQLTDVAFADDPTHGFAGLDVIQGLDSALPAADSPILFPGPGSTTTLLAANLSEEPSPLETCGWQTEHPGLPMIALFPQAPAADMTASLSGPDGMESSANGELCVVDENTYYSSDQVYGPAGLDILRYDNAVILIPASPLENGSYSVDIKQAGQADTEWSFNASVPDPVNTTPPVIQGTAIEGGQLIVDQGSWTGSPTKTFDQWLR